ncbi:MAG: DUF115 domain-containing protein [Treponema sp.]|nr:DUF115 domain-containing protein [Treponema sp.]
MKIYKEFIQTKNETQIPVFQSGRTMESRYNPQNEAQKLCDATVSNAGFFLVTGIGSGIFLEMLSNKFKNAKIVALELYKEDIDFLRTQEKVRLLEKNENIVFCTLLELEQTLVNHYIPAKYGDFQVIEQRAWINENKENLGELQSIIQKTLGIISADYSVQAHFGKIWNHNILNNARLSQFSKSAKNFCISKNDLEKTAVIVAAGPSLDKTLCLLKKPGDFFVIATDTANSVLEKSGIFADLVISIDGQAVSYNHFIKPLKANTTAKNFAFDFCANHSAANKTAQFSSPIFFCSGHPLSSLINQRNNQNFPFVFSGSGTVTISAIDFAVQAGFSKIKILGADFSYKNGKPYAKGTYLDSLYNIEANRLKTSETLFSKLMFRTPLIKMQENSYTTQILEAYKTSLEKYLIGKKISFVKKDDFYELEIKSKSNNQNFCKKEISANFFASFMSDFSKENPKDVEFPLLPFIAWLRKNQNHKNDSYEDLLKLAFNNIVSYNE